MKINLSDQKRAEIDSFLPQYKQSISSLSRALARVTDLQKGRAANESSLSTVASIEDPTDKQIQQILVCRERAAILQRRGDEAESTLGQGTKVAVVLANEAAELFRTAAAKEIFEQGEKDFKASLPAAITSDQHLLFKVWNEGAEKRRIGRFLNPPALSANDDPEEILGESRRRAALLEDLIEGREVFAEAQTAAA